MHEIKLEFSEGLHETESELLLGDSGKMHEAESDIQEEPHETKSEILEVTHEVRSEFLWTAALAEMAAKILLEGLRQVAGFR